MSALGATGRFAAVQIWLLPPTDPQYTVISAQVERGVAQISTATRSRRSAMCVGLKRQIIPSGGSHARQLLSGLLGS